MHVEIDISPENLYLFKCYFLSEFFIIKLFICVASTKSYTQMSAKNLTTEYSVKKEFVIATIPFINS